MKTWRTYLAICACLCSVLCNSAAQTSADAEKPSLPPGDLLRTLAPKEAWTISFQYKERNVPDEGKPFSEASPPGQVRIIRLEPYLSLHIAGRNRGDTISYYARGGFLYVDHGREPGPARVLTLVIDEVESPPISEEILVATLRGHFFGFEWVGPETYAGVEEVDGLPCLVFKNEDAIAWVDLEKRQPVQWQRGVETRRFVQNPPPTSNEIPEDVLRRMRNLQKDIDALSKPPLRGG
jgi:hypothetical protein